MPFAKGQSGNPGGRPKYSPAFKKALELAVMPAFKTLLAIMNDPESNEMARIKCAEVIFERHYGKSPQTLTDTDGNNVGQIVYIQLPIKDTGNGKEE